MPLAKRYGAALLCLPICSGDLPEKAEDRIALAESIVNRAYGYGLQPHDLLLDPLVLTLASGEDSARQTLRTLQSVSYTHLDVYKRQTKPCNRV